MQNIRAKKSAQFKTVRIKCNIALRLKYDTINNDISESSFGMIYLENKYLQKNSNFKTIICPPSY